MKILIHGLDYFVDRPPNSYVYIMHETGQRLHSNFIDVSLHSETGIKSRKMGLAHYDIMCTDDIRHQSEHFNGSLYVSYHPIRDY
jgi:hypothetical protein